MRHIGDLRTVLGWWARSARSLPPFDVPCGKGRPPILVFTDGACEDNAGVVGYGGVMFDPESGEARAFGRRMGIELRNKLSLYGKKKQIVGQAELYPMVVITKEGHSQKAIADHKNFKRANVTFLFS